MAEGSEVEERVDLDEDNYMEEIDDDVEEHLDEDVDVDGGSNENQDEEQENSKAEASEPDSSPDVSPTTNNEVEAAEERPVASLSDEDREKHAQLLSLPPHGSEVFIGGLPRDVLEEDLRDLCEPIGEVFEVRLVKDKGTGESKGYAFVAFKTEELAQKAIEELHSKEFKGKTLRCSLAESKNRLFIGNIPKILKDDEFRKAIEEVGPGVDSIELIKDPQIPSRNRGFAFVLYYNNACAEYSRQKMSSINFKLDGHNPTVTWADPKSAPDQSAASQQVKALYVKNIPENTTTEQLKELFQRHGEVTKVVMPPSKSGSSKRDFGFVHFAERSSALKAVKDSERYEIEGQALEVVLAKPQNDKKSDSSGLHPGQLAYPGYGGGLVANPFGSGYGVSPSYQQPMIYGRGPMPSGMQMVPMVLPDGRIGYVLQQPGVQMPPHPRPSRRTDRHNGGGGHGGRGSSSGSGSNASEEGSRNRRYRPY